MCVGGGQAGICHFQIFLKIMQNQVTADYQGHSESVTTQPCFLKTVQCLKSGDTGKINNCSQYPSSDCTCALYSWVLKLQICDV